MAADEYAKGSIAYGHNDVNNKFIICHGSRMNRKQDFLKIIVIIAATPATSGDRELIIHAFQNIQNDMTYHRATGDGSRCHLCAFCMAPSPIPVKRSICLMDKPSTNNCRSAASRFVLSQDCDRANRPRCHSSYKATPSFAYTIGEYTLDRHGVLTGPQNQQLLATLEQDGYRTK